ncbi:MAG: hypothetical protein F6K58_16745 [Symploca sp. SIO2E9]|nr:hypothetical protein [Symploca sp. SIO2E9]
MSNILLVPIHLDALYLNQQKSVVEEMTDYSKLPYKMGPKDPHKNSEYPYVSDSVLSPPFENLNLSLKAGIHLHWALPDALTQGIAEDDGNIHFPLVPNRWLIMRRDGKLSAQKLPDKQWVVESDYLYPDGEEPEDTINILHHPTCEDGDYRPFRYLGRKLELREWPQREEATYIETLSAIGPFAQVTSLDNEKATFAAFYPNCRSVFGFHDDEITQDTQLEGLQYDVIGWYDTPDKDYFRKFLDEHSDSETLLAAIEEEFGWKLPKEVDNITSLEGMICYSRLTFNAGALIGERASKLEKPKIAVGNSPTEALAAYLAHQLSDDQEHRQIIEEQLEALELSVRFAAQQLDIGPKFEQARHAMGFTGESVGVVWRVLPEDNNSGSADASYARAQAQVTLPDEIAEKLNTLNLRQLEYDRALAKIGMIREQLYADWHKYMLALHIYTSNEGSLPDDSDLKDFIDLEEYERGKHKGKYNGCSIYDLQQEIAQTGTLEIIKNENGEITGANSDSPPESIAAQLAEAINEIIQTLNGLNGAVRQLLLDKNNPSQLRYLLKVEPGERYWEANNPVVLMVGDAVTPSSRHGQDGRLHSDGLLECQLLTETINLEDIQVYLETFKLKLDELGNVEGEKIGFQERSQQPWHPFMLHWSVQIFPVKHSDDPSQDKYDSALITDHYQLPVNSPDLLLQPEADNNFVDDAQLYAGACILTPSASILLKEQINSYLSKVLLPLSKVLLPDYDGYDGSEDFLSQHWEQIKIWYEEKLTHASEEEKVNDPIYTALRAYEMLQSLNCMAQQLGGFNDALLTYKREMQLDVDDPLAIEVNQEFHQKVRDAVARGDVPSSLLRGPLILNEFNPWRTGALDISRLRILDTFGQVQDVVNGDEGVEVITTAAMTPPAGGTHPIYLPPRLAQAARLNFWWLSASQGEVQTNDHPATTPICGWILPNYLDNSLMVYQTQGQPLGMIQVRDEQIQWLPTPGSEIYKSIEEVKSDVNLFLGQILDYLSAQDQAYFQKFLTVIESALESIEPDNYSQHQSIALMMGRPIALVRAKVNLELLGQPSISQNESDTKQDVEEEVENVPRTTYDFTKVNLPIRIGEYRQLNDGLVGYWVEAEEHTYQEEIFYAPQSVYVSHEKIQTLFEDEEDGEPDTAVNLEQNLEAQTAQTLAMLVDPRGVVNATCGFLPARAISIPPEHFAQALKSIEVTFLSTPIISERDRLNISISLADIPDYTWSWIAKEGENWLETTEIGKVNTQANFTDQGHKIYEGWLKLSQKDGDDT